MYRILAFVFVLMFAINLFANTSPFVVERVTTDFNSVVYSNGKILCFGNYGIITHSTDDGATWQQTKLNEKYNIYKVIQLNNDLIGITQNAIIKSNDNGKTWEIKEISDTILAISGLEKGSVVLLTKNSLLEYDLNLLEKSNVTIDSNYLAKEMTSLGNSIFLPIQDFKLYTYNFDSNKSNSINLRTTINCSSCMKANSIKTSENKLYLVANNDLYNSTDNGNNWSLKTRGVTNNYLVDSSKVYEISCFKSDKPLSKSTLFSNSKVDLFKFRYDYLNSSGVRSQVNTDTLISKIAFSFSFNMIIKRNSKLFAVGNNNLILTSYDNGLNWTFKSLYNTSYGEFHLKKNNMCKEHEILWCCTIEKYKEIFL